MVLRLTHRTEYSYPFPSRDSHNEVRLCPMQGEFQRRLDFRITTNPAANVFSHDEPGGTVHHFAVREPHRRLDIVVEATVETLLVNPFEQLNLLCSDWSFYEQEATRLLNTEYLTPSPHVSEHPETLRIGQQFRGAKTSVSSFLLEVNRHLHEWLEYDPDVTHAHTKIEEVLRLRAGVCQDFAHVMIGCCREAGIPTRYVSGYLFVRAGSGMRGEQATHAWVECLMPSGDWIGLDPTNNVLVNDHYIKVHVGRDYSEVTPTRGVYWGPPASQLCVSVDVQMAATEVSTH